MKILLLSAYHAVSHRYWCDGLMNQCDEHDWTLLSLPARYFQWRIRGNPLSWWSEQSEVLRDRYDLIVATSMVDLTTLRGLFPGLAQTPCVLYLHENQFAYPPGNGPARVEPQMVSIYSALAADWLLFNSQYNLSTFMTGVDDLMRKLPDHCPRDLSCQLRAKSSVLPVPLFQAQATCCDQAGDDASADQPGWEPSWGDADIKIVWASRWEYDKGPDRLLRVLRELERRGTQYRIAILGEQFRHSPKEFETIRVEFSHRLARFGFVESRHEFQRWLSSADIILSTSIHEFQGLAVLEAVAAGCVPVLPRRLAYPELVPEPFLYDDRPDDQQREAVSAVDLIQQHGLERAQAPSIERFRWSVRKPDYERLLNKVAGHTR